MSSALEFHCTLAGALESIVFLTSAYFCRTERQEKRESPKSGCYLLLPAATLCATLAMVPETNLFQCLLFHPGDIVTGYTKLFYLVASTHPRVADTGAPAAVLFSSTCISWFGQNPASLYFNKTAIFLTREDPGGSTIEQINKKQKCKYKQATWIYSTWITKCRLHQPTCL